MLVEAGKGGVICDEGSVVDAHDIDPVPSVPVEKPTGLVEEALELANGYDIEENPPANVDDVDVLMGDEVAIEPVVVTAVGAPVLGTLVVLETADRDDSDPVAVPNVEPPVLRVILPVDSAA